MNAYQTLETAFARAAKLNTAARKLGWDQRVMMPAGGAADRGEEMATLAAVAHEIVASPAIADALGALDGMNLDEVQTANVREMQRVHWVDPDWETTWGLGFNVFQEDGMTVVGHGGGCPGYITQYLMNPKDRIAVVVLTNAGDGAAYDLALGGIKLMTAAIGDISEMPTDTPDYSAYEGSYEGKPWGDEVAIRQAGDYLLVVSAHGSSLDGDVTRLEHQEGDTFVRLTDDGEPRETWTFLMGDDGKARALRTHSSESTRVEF